MTEFLTQLTFYPVNRAIWFCRWPNPLTWASNSLFPSNSCLLLCNSGPTDCLDSSQPALILSGFAELARWAQPPYLPGIHQCSLSCLQSQPWRVPLPAEWWVFRGPLQVGKDYWPCRVLCGFKLRKAPCLTVSSPLSPTRNAGTS